VKTQTGEKMALGRWRQARGDAFTRHGIPRSPRNWNMQAKILCKRTQREPSPDVTLALDF
jgi:hypothetical protein